MAFACKLVYVLNVDVDEWQMFDDQILTNKNKCSEGCEFVS